MKALDDSIVAAVRDSQFECRWPADGAWRCWRAARGAGACSATSARSGASPCRSAKSSKRLFLQLKMITNDTCVVFVATLLLASLSDTTTKACDLMHSCRASGSSYLCLNSQCSWCRACCGCRALWLRVRSWRRLVAQRQMQSRRCSRGRSCGCTRAPMWTRPPASRATRCTRCGLQICGLS